MHATALVLAALAGLSAGIVLSYRYKTRTDLSTAASKSGTNGNRGKDADIEGYLADPPGSFSLRTDNTSNPNKPNTLVNRNIHTLQAPAHPP